MVLYLIEDNTQGCCIVTEGLVVYLESYFEMFFTLGQSRPTGGKA